MFPAFTSANNIGSLVNNLFGVNIFNPFHSINSSSSPCSGVIGDKSSSSEYKSTGKF